MGEWFGKILGAINLDLFFDLPQIDFPSWSFMKGGCLRIDSFTAAIDTCGIKEIFDALKAAFCSLKNLNFDKFLKDIKKGIKAVINFGKNIINCFRVKTKGLEAVFDAFPFVKTAGQTLCTGAIFAAFLATFAYIIQQAGNAIGKALSWLLSGLKSLAGSAGMSTRSNRSSRGYLGQTDVVGIKSAVDVQGAKLNGDAKCNAKCWRAGGLQSAKNSITNWNLFRKKMHGVATPLKYIHMFAFALNFPFAVVTNMAMLGGKLVAFLVIKFVCVITKEEKVGTWADFQFALFYGTVVALPLLSMALESLKKLSPYAPIHPALGISWTGDMVGAIKYGTNKFQKDPKKRVSKRKKSNAVFLQALSINPKIEVGWPAYPGKKWGLTVPVEFKPIWLMWTWGLESLTFTWWLGSQPLTDMQIEYDLIVYVPDAGQHAISRGEAFNPAHNGDLMAGVSFKGKEKGAGAFDQQLLDQSAARSADMPSGKAKKGLLLQAEVWFFGSFEVGKQVIQMFKNGPWGFLVELLARISLAIMFWGWVYAVCAWTCNNTKPNR